MDEVALAKQQLRRQVAISRGARSPEGQSAAADALAARVVQLPELVAGSAVAAYVSVGDEPGTRPLLASLLAGGQRVLVPVLRPDLDLDWGELTDLSALRPGRRGLPEPVGPRLGPDAVADVAVVVCPGLAGDQTGARLGRGGGSYDRALARCDATTWRCLLLHDDEQLPAGEVPVEPHDQRVHALVTPGALVRCRTSFTTAPW